MLNRFTYFIDRHRQKFINVAWIVGAAVFVVFGVKLGITHKDFALIAGPMFGTALVPIGLYCYRSHGKEDFNIWKFIITNRGRLVIGGILMAYISWLIYFFPAAQAVVAGGLGSGVTEAAIGWAMGTTLVALVPGQKI
jgi:hypothetical protein